MRHQWKFFTILGIGVIAAILDFLCGAPKIGTWPISGILIDIFGIFMAITMLREMIHTLESGRWGVDILAIIAVVSTMIVGDYWAAWMILIMLTGGDSLEDYATSQADKELRSLLQNSPRIADKLVNGKIEEVKVDDLKIGDIVLIKPGSQVPVDGEIIKGNSSFDQSSLTGESVPVDKKVGDNLMSGSINGDAAVEMKVTKAAKDSEYQSIVALVKSSEAKPAKFVKMADRYAVPFTIISLIIGIAAMITSAVTNPALGWQGHFLRFAQVMVVASPCPLLIAAPVAMVSGMSSMSRSHIIVKSGTTLEKLSRTLTFAFDKTGTLTENQLVIDQVILAKDSSISKEELQSLAASVEQQSSHVIATSLVKSTDKNLIKPVTNLKEATAKGVSGEVDSKLVKVGKLSYVDPDQEKITINSTAVFVSIDNKFAGYITFQDQMRKNTPETISRLRRQGIKQIMMLTGDRRAVADKVAKEAGIKESEVHADLLPAQKIQVIRDVKPDLRPVAMVGDGVNDAPSLMAADVGIAMGAKGATAASESADAVIMVNDISKVNDAVAISKHTMKVAHVDIITAICIVILIELIAFTGIIPAFWGAILQEVVDLITILLALLAKTKPTNPKQTGIKNK
ncbi:heavy metal translocating P-type ATPase [Lactobacillus taiwanensis]|uniref:heavy metal translocating P-type ATPase n=1 Tax=Lactobacillus taiwanensis TaxID=508451 RepID=UPI000B97E97E|nr:heavy metal translocating P-type ATPase [Lactobacillus taiwanensis]OYR96137.1 cadmium-translocating P-type ATPase [Lactobacillus taiwanensis]OYR98649.1 cadmium-translocating P-type ATPase [Lactobacillus taiwanensis]OYS15677.1 cadmium-translocating P-type ATPase [Lactobacillus taiwanensis]OYS32716.1 cadmium-translocating P-type ATPase [Lactobacillus taiwanensis]OYS34419.1 cadmium-translocating P-type ATPase [Lactobacillus taiwanensis]